MTIRDLLPFTPSGSVTVIDPVDERRKEREAYAQRYGKTVDELTPDEYEKAGYIPALDDPCDAFRD